MFGHRDARFARQPEIGIGDDGFAVGGAFQHRRPDGPATVTFARVGVFGGLALHLDGHDGGLPNVADDHLARGHQVDQFAQLPLQDISKLVDRIGSLSCQDPLAEDQWRALERRFFELMILTTPNMDLAEYASANCLSLEACQRALFSLGLPPDKQSLQELQQVLELALSGSVGAAASMLSTHLDKLSARTIAQMKITAIIAPRISQPICNLINTEKHADSRCCVAVRCLIPRFDGAIPSQAWKEALWAKFTIEALRPRTLSKLQ